MKQTVSELVAAPLEAQGYELADVVVSRYKTSTTVRLFVYGENGVTIDECARLSRVIGAVIDGTGLFENGYTLEVSSPGLDRPLLTLRDYKYRVGETVRVEFLDRARKAVVGEIVAVDDNRVTFRVADEVITIDLPEIKRAQIVF
ncbi:MAG: ribosome maturation factor RimP [Candidatus Zixiibacteriota bacterium]